MQEAIQEHGFSISEFTVAPQTNPDDGLPYHEWFIEFEDQPTSLERISNTIDQAMQKQNSYYFDLIEGKILKPLKITPVKKESFKKYMKSQGKLGGQNKLPRLSNDRKIAEKLLSLQD